MKNFLRTMIVQLLSLLICPILAYAESTAPWIRVDTFNKAGEHLSSRMWMAHQGTLEPSPIFSSHSQDAGHYTVYTLPHPTSVEESISFLEEPIEFLAEEPSDPVYTELTSYEINIPLSKIEPNKRSLISCCGKIGHMPVDWAVSCGFLHTLVPTQEEEATGILNLANHLHECLPHNDQSIGLLTYQNGIRTSMKEFLKCANSIANKVPEGTLFIGFYNRSQGVLRDIVRLIREISCIDTPVVIQTRHFIQTLLSQIHEINPQMIWAYIAHSEGALICRRAIDGLSAVEKMFLKQHFEFYALGPVIPIPSDLVLNAKNVYSWQDFLGIASRLLGLGGYDLLHALFGPSSENTFFVPCASPWSDKSFYLFDHAFLGSTYDAAIELHIQSWREAYTLHHLP